MVFATTQPNEIHLHNLTKVSKSIISVKTAIKHTAFHPGRNWFLTINVKGEVSCYSISDKKPKCTVALQTTAATWWGDSILAASEDFNLYHVDLETKELTPICQIGSPATSILAENGKLVVGTKTGHCEVYSLTETLQCEKLYEAVVGIGGSDVLNIHLVCLIESLSYRCPNFLVNLGRPQRPRRISPNLT